MTIKSSITYTNINYKQLDKELTKIAQNCQVIKVWTDEETAILKKYYGRIPTSIIAKKLNRTISATKHKATAMGLKANTFNIRMKG